MNDLLLVGARLLAPDGVLADGWLAVADGRIAALGTRGAGLPEAAEVIELRGAWLLPGFLDVHGHGAVGHDTMDADVDGLAAIAAHQARHGVTSFLPTTWTADHPTTLAALEAVAAVAGRRWDGAEVLGAHMEGPYLEPRRCGAQDRRAIRRADPTEVEAYLGTGVVRLITLAPEHPENLELVRTCRRVGVTTSIGHSDATFDQVEAAVEAGVTHATHTGNAMRPLHHREPGTVGGVLDHPAIAAEVIADGIHVHPALLRLVHRVKGVDGMVLVTDAMSATGLAEGTYTIGDRTVEVRDGAVRLPDGALAGSVLTMDRALRTLAAATGAGVAELWPVTSRTPARSIGVADRKGELREGMDADLVVLDEDLDVMLTIVGGRVVHRRSLATTTVTGTTGGGGTLAQ
jgi:N-acetylglucosamine-6-phosphate deacetylase